MITANGRFGIVGDTYASSRAVNDNFLLVVRGAKLGDQLAVVFVNIGSRGNASSVAYGVPASRHPSAWGDIAFPLGVKPIGFADSCWQVRTESGDTGLVLEIGP